MKVRCIDNKIDEWELPDRILWKLTIWETYEVDYEFEATNGLKSQEMYYLKGKWPFAKYRFLLVTE